MIGQNTAVRPKGFIRFMVVIALFEEFCTEGSISNIEVTYIRGWYIRGIYSYFSSN